MRKTLLLIIPVLLLITARPTHAETYWLRGGLIGAGVGVGAGLGASYGACTLSEENTSKCREIAMPISAVLGGGIGFGLGSLIGSAFKKHPVTPQVTINPQNGTYGASFSVEF